MIYQGYLASPIGHLLFEASEKGLRSLKIVDHSVPSTEPIPDPLNIPMQQVQEYFDGKRKVFDLAFDFDGASKFYQQVWQLVYDIPYGETTSYSKIANQLNNPGAVRAVGMANGKNPIPIIIPCHRVIGKNGKLTGYFYGLKIKKQLLSLENPMKFQTQGVLF